MADFAIPVVSVVTAPATEPLTLDQAKSHLRVDWSEEDALITSYMTAARKWAEDVTRRQFVTATLRLTLDTFPGQDPERRRRWGAIASPLRWGRPDAYAIQIPSPPLQAVTSVKYVDAGGTQQVLDPSLYQVDTYSSPGRIAPAWGTYWPICRRQLNSIEVIYTAGYGDASAVPELCKSLIRLLLSQQYENRTPVMVGERLELMPLAVQSIIWMLRWGDYP